MTLAQFKTILGKFNRNLGQVALGIGDIDGNPDLFNIMEYARKCGVVPNLTTNGARLTDEIVDRLVSLAGAIAVSRYDPKDVCYDAVKRFTDAGMSQCNIHALCSMETLDNCFELLDDAKNDPRLSKLNAIVFLAGKKKGRGTWLTPVPVEQYKVLVDTALEKGVPFGFDSCSAWKLLAAVKDRPDYKKYAMLAEPCESGLFSAYVDVAGTYYPCSFSDEVVEGINLFEIDDFMKDVWFSENVEKWRERLLGNGRKCPLFDI
jgi:MoaA/NifB/PqqE/SkfB family radical SAM enzyme